LVESTRGKCLTFNEQSFSEKNCVSCNTTKTSAFSHEKTITFAMRSTDLEDRVIKCIVFFLYLRDVGKLSTSLQLQVLMTDVTNKTRAVSKETLYYDGGGIYRNNDFPGLNYRKLCLFLFGALVSKNM